MKILVADVMPDGKQPEVVVYDGIGMVTIRQPYTGFVVEVDQGRFGIAARDGGLEIKMPDGSLISVDAVSVSAPLHTVT